MRFHSSANFGAFFCIKLINNALYQASIGNISLPLEELQENNCQTQELR